MNPVLTSSVKMDYGTPQGIFDRLDVEFSFNLDPCALADTAKCDRYFAPPVESFAHPMDLITAARWDATVRTVTGFDGLAWDWKGCRAFVNPPYGNALPAWAAKIVSESAELIVLLVPARPDPKWWATLVDSWKYSGGMSCTEVRFIRGRLAFEGVTVKMQDTIRAFARSHHETTAARRIPKRPKKLTGAAFPSAVLVFRPGISSRDWLSSKLPPRPPAYSYITRKNQKII